MMEDRQVRVVRNPILIFTDGLRAGERLEIQKKICVIGREPGVDIQLDSHFVSRRHAEISFQRGYWFITDCWSKNGVFKNRTRIHPGTPVNLFERDRIQIGNISTFEFHDPEATVHESEVGMTSPGLWLDEPNRDVTLGDKRLSPPLSPQQFTLLAALVHKGGRVITNRAIADYLWPEAAGGVERAAIDNAISRLRSRLAELDKDHDYIETVRGVGRRFVQREMA